MDKIKLAKIKPLRVSVPEVDPENLSAPVKEMLATESPEQLHEVAAKYEGMELTHNEVSALRQHGVTVHVNKCFGAECGEGGEFTKEDIKAAMTQCAKRHADVMDDFFEEVGEAPAESASDAGTLSEGE